MNSMKIICLNGRGVRLRHDYMRRDTALAIHSGAVPEQLYASLLSNLLFGVLVDQFALSTTDIRGGASRSISSDRFKPSARNSQGIEYQRNGKWFILHSDLVDVEMKLIIPTFDQSKFEILWMDVWLPDGTKYKLGAPFYNNADLIIGSTQVRSSETVVIRPEGTRVARRFFDPNELQTARI